MLEGTSLQNSGIEFQFKRNVDNVLLCEMYALFSFFDWKETHGRGSAEAAKGHLQPLLVPSGRVSLPSFPSWRLTGSPFGRRWAI